MEDENNISDDDTVMLNSSITEGAVTRALYGDEHGNLFISSLYAMITHVTCHRVNNRSC